MGELLLCSESIAAMPFYLEGISINIYSIEELEYYIINNTFLLDNDFMSMELCDWIDEQAKQKKLADSLRRLIDANGRLSEFVEKIVDYTGYCTIAERKQLIETLRQMEEKSEFECAKIRADKLMENRKYLNSILEYRKLLETEDAMSADDSLCGDIYNNLAIAYSRLFLFDTALELFKKAYSLNKKRQSLWYCLYIAKITDNDSVFKKLVSRYEVSEDEISQLDSVVNSVLYECKNQELTGDYLSLISKYKNDYRRINSM